jgi:hypothetical protein
MDGLMLNCFGGCMQSTLALSVGHAKIEFTSCLRREAHSFRISSESDDHATLLDFAWSEIWDLGARHHLIFLALSVACGWDMPNRYTSKSGYRSARVMHQTDLIGTWPALVHSTYIIILLDGINLVYIRYSR